MEANTLIADLFAGLERSLHVALDDIEPDKLTYRPGEHSNTIAWLVWHLSRVQDRRISELSGQHQAWVAQGWYAKFGRPADASESGIGFTPEQVESIKPSSAQLLFDYYHAVLARSTTYLQSLTAQDLDRVVDPADPQGTVGFRLRQCILDNVSHAGQAAYLRGLIEGRRVYPA